MAKLTDIIYSLVSKSISLLVDGSYLNTNLYPKCKSVMEESCKDKLTQSILAKAFRGELVPQDPNDEPASELLKRIQETANA